MMACWSPKSDYHRHAHGEARPQSPASGVEVSKKHAANISRLISDRVIRTDLVAKAMASVDFEFFYGEVLTSWIHQNVTMLENAVKVLCRGDHVLNLSPNIYFSVCLAKLIGHSGSVISFANKAQVKALKKCGLIDLVTSGRLTLVLANDLAGRTSKDFQRYGYAERMPYRVIFMSNQATDLTECLRCQLATDGLAYVPESGRIVLKNRPKALTEEEEDISISDIPPHLRIFDSFL